MLNKTKSGAKVADAMKQLEVEGGLAGKWKVLYEVSITLHAQFAALSYQHSVHNSVCPHIAPPPPSPGLFMQNTAEAKDLV